MNYYIQGNKEKAEQIKAAFEKLGYSAGRLGFIADDAIYYTTDEKIVDLACSNFLINLIKTHPGYQELKLPVEPKFKVGDKVLDNMMIVTVRDVVYDQNYKEYKYGIGSYWVFESALKLYKPHYDISNLKPFDKVLVRDANCKIWRAGFYSHRDNYNWFVCAGSRYAQCIPYNDDTKHLLGTTDMCDECYVNW